MVPSFQEVFPAFEKRVTINNNFLISLPAIHIISLTRVNRIALRLWSVRFLRQARKSGLLACGFEVGIEFSQDFLPCSVDIYLQILKHAGGNAVALPQQPQQDVLGSDLSMIE